MSSQEIPFKITKIAVDLKIFFNVPYFLKLILNSPYDDKQIVVLMVDLDSFFLP